MIDAQLKEKRTIEIICVEDVNDYEMGTKRIPAYSTIEIARQKLREKRFNVDDMAHCLVFTRPKEGVYGVYVLAEHTIDPGITTLIQGRNEALEVFGKELREYVTKQEPHRILTYCNNFRPLCNILPELGFNVQRVNRPES